MGRLKALDIRTEAQVLEQLGRCRQSMAEVRRVLVPRAMLYREAGFLMDQIDEIALLITGNRDHFHAPPHSTHGPRGAGNG